MKTRRLPERAHSALKAAVRQLTDANAMSNEVRQAIIDNPDVRIYLDTWVTANLKQVLAWSDNEMDSQSITVMGGRY